MSLKLTNTSEEDMARSVVTELQRQGWSVYEEVSTGRGEKRADIVGVRGHVLMVVECKTSLSLKLLDQLMWWRGEANYIVGAYGGGRVGQAASTLCKTQGVGLWFVGFEQVKEEISPRLHRRRWGRLKDALRPEQQTQEYAKAGSQGGYWTPFRQTCRDLYRVVEEHPGIELREALRRFNHHYANQTSAMSSLPGLIRKGVVAGVRVDDSVPLKLFLEGDVPDSFGAPGIEARTPPLQETP